MILNLVRHAEAEDTLPPGGDAVRRLTAEGRREAFDKAGQFKARLENVEVILTSPYARALETAEIFGVVLNKIQMIVADAALAAITRPENVLSRLQEYAGHAEIMLVGHEPWMTGLASLLISGAGHCRILLKKPGLIRIQVEELAPHGGVLLNVL